MVRSRSRTEGRQPLLIFPEGTRTTAGRNSLQKRLRIDARNRACRYGRYYRVQHALSGKAGAAEKPKSRWSTRSRSVSVSRRSATQRRCRDLEKFTGNKLSPSELHRHDHLSRQHHALQHPSGVIPTYTPAPRFWKPSQCAGEWQPVWSSWTAAATVPRDAAGPARNPALRCVHAAGQPGKGRPCCMVCNRPRRGYTNVLTMTRTGSLRPTDPDSWRLAK